MYSKVYYNKRNNAPAYLKFKSGLEPNSTDGLNWMINNFGLSDNFKFNSIYNRIDELGIRHEKFQPAYLGVPIEFSSYTIHSKNGKIISLSGDLDTKINPLNKIIISEQLALKSALDFTNAKEYFFQIPGYEASMKESLNDKNFSLTPKAILVLFPIGNGEERTFKYAYKFDIWASNPESREDVYVDAQSGEVLDHYQKLHTADVKGTAVTKYSGIRIITTDSVPAKDTIPAYFRLKESNRDNVGFQIETKSLKNGTNPAASIELKDADNYWNNINAKFDEAATDAHFAAEKTYDVFKKELGRNSWNNAGGKLNIYVHWDNIGTVNAQWNGAYAQFGDGGGNPLTSLDVVGHEIGHGVTGSSAGLVYRSESGALNESFSDIFGSIVEYHTDSAGFKWDLGKSTFVLRDMSNPNRFGNPDTYGSRGKNWTNTNGCVPSQANDQCGVHNNSGVQNYWFFLMVEGTKGKSGNDTVLKNDNDSLFSVVGLGWEPASKIAYRNLTEYLTNNSDYADARFYSIIAAEELYGVNSQAVISTTNAWYGVGLGKKYSVMPISDFKVTGQVCGLDQKISFENTSGSATEFIWLFGDGDESNQINPNHTYVDPGNYTVTLIAQNANGSDTLIRKDLITVFEDCPKTPECPAATGLSTARYGPLRVRFANIDNETNDGKTDGPYKDYTGIRALVAPGQNYDLTVTTDATFVVTSRAWIDFNDDGAFGTNELILKVDSGKNIQKVNFMIPSDAVQGKSLRMRVNSFKPSKTANADDPCATVKGGQTEEYSVLIDPKYLGLINLENNSDFVVIPNPSNNGIFKLEFNLINENKFVIFNSIGSTILSGELNNANQHTLDLSRYPKGIYYLNVFSDKENTTKKLIIN